MTLPDRLRGFFTSRRAVATAGLVCIALMLVSVNIIAARFFAWRLDLTDEHLYTLSRGTLTTLRSPGRWDPPALRVRPRTTLPVYLGFRRMV